MPPKVHLPEAVLCMDEALRKVKIVGCGGVDVWHAHAVAINIYRGIESIQFDIAIHFGEGFGSDRIWQIAFEIVSTTRAKQYDDDQWANANALQDCFIH